MTRPARAIIDLAALQHNINCVKELAPNSKIMSVIKANGYGHGMERVAKSLDSSDGFAVASVDEGIILRNAGIKKPIFLLSGFHNKNELPDVLKNDLLVCVHSENQLSALSKWQVSTENKDGIKVWCKLDTGMHRIGFMPDELPSVLENIDSMPNVELAGVMSHFANADDLHSDDTNKQTSEFNKATKNFSQAKSLANSAGIVGWKNSHLDWVRPGIMLYGSSPVLNKTSSELNLQPVMKLESEIIAIKHLKKNDLVGYGGEWQCPEDMSVAIVAIGYGDGYPRSAGLAGAPVYLNNSRSRVLGRVSMDMITIDLRGLENTNIGDKVELWGQNISIDEIAKCCKTISYELMCQVTSRVSRLYIN